MVEGNGATVIYRDSLIQNVDEYTVSFLDKDQLVSRVALSLAPFVTGGNLHVV